MATNKPPIPRIAFFDGWSYWCMLIVTLVSIPAYFQISPVGDMPRSTWWWYIGLFLFLLAAHVARYVIIRRRNTPVWTWSEVEPWSDPLRFRNGQHLDTVTWLAVSSGQSYEEAYTAYYTEPGRAHQVDDAYAKYLAAFKTAYVG